MIGGLPIVTQPMHPPQIYLPPKLVPVRKAAPAAATRQTIPSPSAPEPASRPGTSVPSTLPPTLPSRPATSANPRPAPSPGNGGSNRIRIPSPEELGVGTMRGEPALDWRMVERRLDQVGAIGYHLERRDDQYHCLIDLPGRTLSGSGLTRAEAINNALAALRR